MKLESLIKQYLNIKIKNKTFYSNEEKKERNIEVETNNKLT